MGGHTSFASGSVSWLVTTADQGNPVRQEVQAGPTRGTLGSVNLARGENRPLPGNQVQVTVRSASPVDVSALLLGPGGKVRSDADFVFFNNPVGPGVSYHHGQGRGDMVQVDTRSLPRDVDTVVVTASLDGSGPRTFAAAGSLVTTIGDLTFEMSGLTTESGVVCVEIYRRNDQWKVRAVGQGFDNGLAGIATAYGVDIESDSPPPAQSHATPGYAAQPGHPGHSAPPAPPGYAAPPAQPGYSAPPAQPGYSSPPAQPGYGAPAQPGFPAPPAQPGYSAPPAQPGYAPQPAQSYAQGAPHMQSELFQNVEAQGMGIQKQGGKMIKVAMNGEVMARAGSMVAYQGDMRFEALGAGGIGNMIRQRLSGEGVPLMKVSGRGDLFLANAASDVHIIDLDGSDGLTINGANVLCFDSTISYRIGRVQGAAGFASNAGLFNCIFEGRGRIAITTEGTPVVLQVDQPTYADPQAAVAWSSSLQTGIKQNDSFNLGTLMGRSTGERHTLSFSGRGFVIVQPSELPPGGFIGGAGGGEQAGHSGGMLGGFLGR